MEQYLVLDWYEDPSEPEILGIDLTLDEAKALREQRIEDTDGECDVTIHDNEMDWELYEEMYSRLYD